MSTPYKAYKAVGRIVKAHGNKGKLVAHLRAGFSGVLAADMPVCLVPPALTGDRFHIITALEEGPTGLLLSLSGVEDRSAAEEAADKTVLVAEELLPFGWELHDVDSLIGRSVEDAERAITGTISEIATGPANDVWYVATEAGEVALPVIDEVVSDVPAEGTIFVHIPHGLEPEGARP